MDMSVIGSDYRVGSGEKHEDRRPWADRRAMGDGATTLVVTDSNASLCRSRPGNVETHRA